MLSSNVKSIDLPVGCMAWRFWTMKQPYGCSTSATRSSAAKQWFEQLAQKKNQTVRLHVSDFTTKCIGVFVVYLNIIERSSQLKSTTGELLADKVVRAFYFALLWLVNFKTTGWLVGRQSDAPATTRLTPQLVEISVTYQQLQSLHWFPDRKSISNFSGLMQKNAKNKQKNNHYSPQSHHLTSYCCFLLCVSALANLSTSLSRRANSYIVDTLVL